MIDDYSNFCEMFFAPTICPLPCTKVINMCVLPDFMTIRILILSSRQNYVTLPHHPSMYPQTPGTMAMSSAKTNSIFSS